MKKIKLKLNFKLSQVIDIFHWAVILLLTFTSITLVLSTFDNPLHLRVFSVNSGSMAPTIKMGSLVFITPKSSYSVGDVVTFTDRRDINKTTTHRIFEIQKDEDIGTISYKTKGDANEDPDMGSIRESQIIGKVIFKMPVFGFISSFAKTQLGFTFLIVIPATIIVYSEIVNVKKEISGFMGDRIEKKKSSIRSIFSGK